MACTMRICEITELRRFQSIQANRVQVKLVRTSGISCAGTDDLREWLSSDIYWRWTNAPEYAVPRLRVVLRWAGVVEEEDAASLRESGQIQGAGVRSLIRE
jgi:hypothetical protein